MTSHYTRTEAIEKAQSLNPQISIVVLSGISTGNIGDDAMLIATVQDLLEQEPNLDITVLAENPESCGSVAEQIGVPIHYSPQLLVQKLLSESQQGTSPQSIIQNLAAKLIAGDSDLVFDKLGPGLEPHFKEGIRKLIHSDGVIDCGGASLTVHWKYYFFEKCLDYLIAAKPLFVTGQQVDDFHDPADITLLHAALKRVDRITLRERQSERYLRSLNVETNMQTTGDDALTLNVSSPDRISDLVSNSGLLDNTEYVAFQYRHFLDYDQPHFWDRMAAYVDAVMTASNLGIVAVPMHFGWIDERKHLEQVRQRTLAPEKFHIVPNKITPNDAKGLFQRAEFAFGISYHSAVLSLSAGTPYLGLYFGKHYERKMEGLAELYHDHELAVPMNEISPKEFTERVRARLMNRNLISQQLSVRHAELKSRVRRARRQFLDSLRPH